MKLAIVGCGFIAERYATDLGEDRSRAFVSRHGGTAYPDLAALLRESDAELVISLTVHAAHAEVTRTCLGAGRHVFSEKPLALDAEEARDLVDFCHGHHIRVMAYSPLAAPGLLRDPTLVRIADKHGCTLAQVVLAWNLAEGIVPIPSSTTRAHLSANLDVMGLELDTDDTEEVGGSSPKRSAFACVSPRNPLYNGL